MTKKISFLRKYATGGMTEMPTGTQESVPTQTDGAAGAQDQMMQMLSQVIQTQDPNMALEFCNQLGTATGIAPESGGGSEEAMTDESGIPAQKNGGNIPVFAKGGKIKLSAKDKMLAAKNGQRT